MKFGRGNLGKVVKLGIWRGKVWRISVFRDLVAKTSVNYKFGGEKLLAINEFDNFARESLANYSFRNLAGKNLGHLVNVGILRGKIWVNS